MYAQLCYFCSKEFESFKFSETSCIKNEFKNAILLYVEQSFKNKESAESTGLSAEELQERQGKRKRKIEGNVRFIGELFNVGLISPKVILLCVHDLLNVEYRGFESIDIGEHEFLEENLVGTCILLETGAVKLEHPKMAAWTAKIYSFLDKLRERHTLSSKLKFMLMNLVEERWAKRRATPHN